MRFHPDAEIVLLMTPSLPASPLSPRLPALPGANWFTRAAARTDVAALAVVAGAGVSATLCAARFVRELGFENALQSAVCATRGAGHAFALPFAAGQCGHCFAALTLVSLAAMAVAAARAARPGIRAKAMRADRRPYG